MSFNNIRSNTQSRHGFTIVELLIVVVVIAILASITIVSYNGITSRANASAAKTTAISVQKKAELYASDGPTGQYPMLYTNLTTAATNTVYYLSGVKFTTNPATNPSSTEGKDTVKFVTCGIGSTTAQPTTISALASATGNIISYYNYTAGSGVESINIGQVTGVTNGYTIGCPTS
jgi:type IV pilus assembly protein PilA